MGQQLSDVPRLGDQLEGCWFKQYFRRLHDICRSLMTNYGTWTGLDCFAPIGDVLEEIVAENGVSVTVQPDDNLWVDVSA
ncbi:MAG: hypothetical protein OXH68_21905 [Gammaproteobacteria bacterium]|nr:hypothetical protein [Gammaproteobacteria bacterium]